MKLCKIVLLSSILFSAVLFSCTKKAPESVQKNNASRIVSLTPAGSEILCAIGAFDQMVARTDFCDYPEQVKSLPSTGGFDGKTLSMETILSFKPDFVYLAKGMHDHLIPLLTQQNISYYVSTANSIEEVLKEISDIGKITGHERKASEVTKKIQQDFEILRNKDQKIVSVYWEIWTPPYMSIGNQSFLNQLIEAAGGKNIFSDVNQAYPVVSEEAIIAAQPEVIILPATAESNGEETIKLRNNWKSIPAVKNSCIYELDANLVSRPGPRIAEAAKLIYETIHHKE